MSGITTKIATAIRRLASQAFAPDVSIHHSEATMLLSIHALIARNKITDTQFFRSAYMWFFQKDADVSGDVLAFRVQGAIPLYVRNYMGYIHSLESA